MNVIILGIDGYIGWPLALHLQKLGHRIIGIDNYSRRERVKVIGGNSIIPIPEIHERNDITNLPNYKSDLHKEHEGLGRLFVNSDVVFHLGQMPSAPWSMIDHSHTVTTQIENVIGNLNVLDWIKENCPKAHLIKIGSMGEYGTPNCVIPEGFIEDTKLIDLPFPKSPGSWYHLSKVHDSHNIHFASKLWGLSATDIMQGVVFGTRTSDIDSPTKATRFDYDECFGTVINRFCAQAVADIPLTVYGKGYQTRSFLPLKDSIECLTRAMDNPPKKGEYRVFNQFAKTYKVNELANAVCDVGYSIGLKPGITHLKNPRLEAQDHYYNPTCQKLKDLGYKPEWDLRDEIKGMLKDLLPHKSRISKDVITPEIKWR